MSENKRKRCSDNSDLSDLGMRRRFTRSSGTDGLGCSMCKKLLPMDGCYIVLHPCGCTVCERCLLAAHAKRGTSPMSCQECDAIVKSHRYFKDRMPEDLPPIIYNTKTETIDDNTMKKNHPFRFLLKTKLDDLKRATAKDAEISILYFASITKRFGRSQLQTIVVAKTMSHLVDGQHSLDYCNQICSFFAFLNPRIVPPSITPFGKIPTLMPRELFDYSIENYTPLFACLYGLATGNSSRPLERITAAGYQDFQSQYLAAADVLKRCTSRHPGHFQLMLNDQVEMQQVSRLFRDLLSAFRLTPSREYSNRRQCIAVVNSLLNGVDVGSNDFCLISNVLNGESS